MVDPGFLKSGGGGGHKILDAYYLSEDIKVGGGQK